MITSNGDEPCYWRTLSAQERKRELKQTTIVLLFFYGTEEVIHLILLWKKGCYKRHELMSFLQKEVDDILLSFGRGKNSSVFAMVPSLTYAQNNVICHQPNVLSVPVFIIKTHTTFVGLTVNRFLFRGGGGGMNIRVSWLSTKPLVNTMGKVRNRQLNFAVLLRDQCPVSPWHHECARFVLYENCGIFGTHKCKLWTMDCEFKLSMWSFPPPSSQMDS